MGSQLGWDPHLRIGAVYARRGPEAANSAVIASLADTEYLILSAQDFPYNALGEESVMLELYFKYPSVLRCAHDLAVSGKADEDRRDQSLFECLDAMLREPSLIAARRS
ncbi:hypothetical protein RFN25_27970 [Mesorhizobium abyssinicae]|uniref:hypothetical protein n=1 Tax=Mesorhizobium abyssinicae TaxID=1209958 RepID=UPI002A23DC17|nr:hypothetical protein [Mesorhizobium abyssinicae]MDX8437258.1 hypothetical protein [Mesorhizobium abyssinicae]